MTSSHRSLVSRPQRYSCSLDLDAARQGAEPQAARWDYILVEKDGTSAGVEVHPAKESEVDRVIAKKRWAEQRPAHHCELRVAAPLHAPQSRSAPPRQERNPVPGGSGAL